MPYRCVTFFIMPRRRYYKRSGSKDKYSICQSNYISEPFSAWDTISASSEFEQDSQQATVIVVPSVGIQGMRKVKHITVTLSSNTTFPVFYAIIYVPEGYEPQALHIPAAGAYVPNYLANQFVMSSGVIDFDAGPTRIRSPISRNLNSGDRIILILATTSASVQSVVHAQTRYAITLQ